MRIVDRVLRRAAAAIVVATAAISLLAPAALATNNDQGGTATTTIRYSQDVLTSSGLPISVYYYNGIGLGGNNLMYLRVCVYYSGTGTNDCSANSAVGVTSTSRTYNLGKLSKGTKFRIQYRAASNPGLNNFWAGTFTY